MYCVPLRRFESVAGRTCDTCFKFANGIMARRMLSEWVYCHDINMLLWYEIYVGPNAAAAYGEKIKQRDYYKMGLFGSDLHVFMGSRASLPQRLRSLRRKFSVNKDCQLYNIF